MVGNLIQKYFQAKPPFSETGKKKNEFPDAIALMSLETWANKNQSKILVVTSDNDWKNFCKSSERLIAIDDFAGALVLCQLPDADDICRDLSERYEKGEFEDVKEAISNALKYRISDIDIYPDANSAYVYEHESTEITFNGFEFKLLEPELERSGEWQYSHRYLALSRTNCRVLSLTPTTSNQFSVNKS